MLANNLIFPIFPLDKISRLTYNLTRTKKGVIKIFGDRLKQFRVSASLTQVELGQKAGIHPITISKWERGELTEVRSTSLLKLAKVLGVTPNDLLMEGEGKDEH